MKSIQIITAALAIWLIVSFGAQAATLRFALPEDEDLADSLQAASLLAETVTDPEARRLDIVAAAQADYRRLLAVMFENGYFGPVISIQIDGTEAAALPVVSGNGAVESVTVTVQPGPRFLFRRAEIAPVPPGTAIPEGFAAGRPAGTDILRETTAAGIGAWRARGHAKAELAAQEIVAIHPENRLDAVLTLAPGPRLRYGPVVVAGAERVRETRISRIADLREGRVFDPEEIDDAAQRLQRTGAFNSVAIVEAEAIGPGDTLPLTIQVAERLPRRFGVGAELSSIDGLSLSAFWLHRNLTGNADSFRVEGDIEGIGGGTGGEDYILSFAYNRPATFNAETDLYANAFIESLDQPNFTAERAGVEVGARRIVSDEFSYSYGVAYERSRVTDAFGERNFSILSLPLEAEYDRRDQDLDPTNGYYIEASVEPFNGFETAGAGLRFLGDFRGYQGFGGERRTVIAARLQLGTVVGPAIDEVPSTDLFFSGGGGTVRGQEFQSLGVTLPSGQIVGGKSFAGFSAELRQSVTDTIGVVGFYDVGMVSANSDWSDGETHSGAGIGLRYDTGIGPIRLDLGFPVSGPDDQTGFAIYIGIGQAF
ncbi:autotransporter assembly complex protein TamA [Jannaschia ovalis]|uniref:Autotransporter assembly complex protein TamA n=1 Tax=Jannaschia ovalis TaxID=3038773 RepID=A0ABY8LBP5_9RHOB|nr:autotransporter assembly complex family protein [Jannaschia sp. GRR-S6-38]WGH77700.1 autotransporter assembly complex protein TamA [Jannaschia sp. GRR-S6-38]